MVFLLLFQTKKGKHLPIGSVSRWGVVLLCIPPIIHRKKRRMLSGRTWGSAVAGVWRHPENVIPRQKRFASVFTERRLLKKFYLRPCGWIIQVGHGKISLGISNTIPLFYRHELKCIDNHLRCIVIALRLLISPFGCFVTPFKIDLIAFFCML